MQKEHKEAIQSNFTSLVEQTDLDSVVTALYEKGVFSEQMIEPYRNVTHLERDRKRKLYTDIMRRGPHAFSHLVDVLGELGYWGLVRYLDPNNPFSLAQSSATSNYNPSPKQKPRSTDNDDFHSLSTLNRPKGDSNKNNPQPTSENDNAACDETMVPHFTVIKSTKFMEDTKDLKLYRTRGQQRGMLLDFTYTEFANNIENTRNGSYVDSNNLKYLFNEFGFRRLGYQNLTRDETVHTLKSLNEVLVGFESVFIVVSSHGYKRLHSSDLDVRCKDGRLISLLDIMDYFNNSNMPALIGVPKVFIFQMCRGDSEDYTRWVESEAPPHMPMPQKPMPQTPMPQADAQDGGVLHALPGVQFDGQPVAPRAAPQAGVAVEKPLFSDILIAHSTLPGFVSHRDVRRGSWYIQALCEVFAERAHDCHVEKLFTLVDKRMQSMFRRQTSSVDRWGFNKRLYLHPGLYEA